MFNGFSVATALLIAVLLGAAFTAYLWLLRSKQAEARAGIEALAAMRWREFSRLVIEALQPRGFTAESVEDSLERGPQADLRLHRQGRIWLLACKQGTNYHITTPVVRELADAVRFNGAEGGILATPGSIQAEARKAAHGIELYDGNALWTLVKPLLPATLRDDLTANARARTARDTALAWGVALLLGFAIAALWPSGSGEDAAAVQTAAQTAAPSGTAPEVAPAPATPAATPAPSDAAGLTSAAPADPNREDFERNEVIRGVQALPGIDRVMWSTRSTLMVYLREDAPEDPAKDICAVLVRYDSLRVSRLHLQPPKDSDRQVRFLQCRTY